MRSSHTASPVHIHAYMCARVHVSAGTNLLGVTDQGSVERATPALRAAVLLNVLPEHQELGWCDATQLGLRNCAASACSPVVRHDGQALLRMHALTYLKMPFQQDRATLPACFPP